VGWERQDFKPHVRRLTEVGLTLSLDASAGEVLDVEADQVTAVVGNELRP
jgi:hypothetical protein